MSEADSLYSRILREMYSPAWLRTGARQTNAAVAKKLGVDEETVRNIVSKMRRSGFLKSWSLSLNPHVLGMQCRSVVIKIEAQVGTSSKEKIKSQLRLVEGIVAIFSFLNDPLLRIVVFYEDNPDLERKIRLISSICETERPKASWEIPFPAHEAALKKTDWKIIRLLLQNSKRNVSDVAKNVGVSTRTVTRRLNFMMEHNSFFLSPIVDVEKVDGFLYHFIISFRDPNVKSKSDNLIRRAVSRIVFADTSAERYSIIAAICQNISEAHEISDLLKKTDGVNEVISTIFEDIVFVHDWISQEIESRIGSSARSRLVAET